ncbi:hypothetical protein Y032_0025g1277 [Ancylostoma ceylanicum]|uniref:Uncharacterized protein n=1 Tax=Ancylostoma ceylanicum TaxID=53326 RepID=A0A016UW81_9BILA|nr:hypothetical protein Y032_0025g1277 [Ancylostoma ceylanicum]
MLHRWHRSNLRANFKLRRLKQVPTEGRHLRKEDRERERERRIKVAQCMKDSERQREINRICMTAQRRMERCMVGTRLLATRTNAWLRGVTKVKDEVTSAIERKWTYSWRLAISADVK